MARHPTELWIESGFNPTLVRLRPETPGTPDSSGGPFQSHAGSIEARYATPGRPCATCSFNPTLVRLRPSSHSIWTKRFARFQSHAGSIEASLPPASTRNVRAEFQSHAGSIEAVGRPLGTRYDLLFQSHAGSIEALRVEAADPDRHRRVSIPRWFD